MRNDFFYSFSLILLVAGTPVWADSNSVQIQTFKTHSRLVIPIDESVSIDWKKEPSRFTLRLKDAHLVDLGVHPTEQKEFLARFKRIQDPRLESLGFSETAQGLVIEGKWRFPSGKQKLAEAKMESFDFFERSPNPRYIIDFWLKKSPTQAEVQRRREVAERKLAIEKAERASAEKSKRRAEEERRKVSMENPRNFCEQPLAESNDVFLPFNPVHEPVDFGRWFSANTADSRFKYYEPPVEVASGEDAQYVRLALKLYREGSLGLALRTLEFLETEHPKSPFLREMRFLKANALIKLNLGDEAQRILAILMEEERKSPVALYAGMYLATHLYKKGLTLAAMEKFMWLIQNYSNHPLAWVFHLGVAESLYAMRQVDRATKEYQWITDHAPDARSRAEGASRIGDLYAARFQHAQALAAYFQTIRSFKSELTNFPSVYINRAESLYELGEYDRARQAYEEFLEQFPTNAAGWRASFRLGEIHARIGGPEETEKGRKWYYETINRFPASPGATLARIRLAPCGDHGGFDQAGAEHFFATEAERFDGNGEVVKKFYGDFRGVARLRTQITFGREEVALEGGITGIDSVKSPVIRKNLANTLHLLFRKRVMELLSSGKKFQALQFYQEQAERMPKHYGSLDPDYLLALSQAASDLGLGQLASDIAAHYEASRPKSQAARELASAGDPDLDMQLRESAKAWVEAKALWTRSGMSPAGKSVSKEQSRLRELLGMVREESPHAMEKEVLLGLLEERSGNLELALAHALNAQLLVPADQVHSEAGLRLSYWVASLEMRAGSSELALGMWQTAEKRRQERESLEKAKGAVELTVTAGVPAIPSIQQSLLVQAELLETLERWGEAAQAYEKASERMKDSNRANYGVANALLNQKSAQSIPKALAVLEKISGSKVDDFWKKLAIERLAVERTKAGNSAREGSNQ